MKVANKQEAWNKVNEIFPTDYIKDEHSSIRAGYPVYRSTAEGHHCDYICDLGDRLEVNLDSSHLETVNIWIEHPTQEPTQELSEERKELAKMCIRDRACTQRRAIYMKDIHPRCLAVLLSRFVTKTPHGIGLGIPETMEMALRECGTLRILFAAFIGAIGKLFGKRGWFYICLLYTSHLRQEEFLQLRGDKHRQRTADHRRQQPGAVGRIYF